MKDDGRYMTHGPGIKSSQQNNLNTGTRLDVNYGVGFREMNKLLGVMVLGLLWCNVGFARVVD